MTGGLRISQLGFGIFSEGDLVFGASDLGLNPCMLMCHYLMRFIIAILEVNNGKT